MNLRRFFHRNFRISEWGIAKKTFFKLFKIAKTAREYWRGQAWISLIAFLLVPLSLFNPYLTKLIVDGPLMSKSTIEFLKYGFIMGVITLVTMIVTNYVQYRQARFSSEVSEVMTRKIYTRLTAFSLDFFRSSDRDRNHYILSGDGAGVVVWSMTFIPQSVIAMLTLIVRVGVVFVIDWRLGLAALLSPPFYLWKANLHARRNRIAARIQRGVNIAYSKELRESLGTMDVVKTFRTEDYHQKRVFGVLSRLTSVAQKNQRFEFLLNSFSGFMVKILDAVPMLIGVLLVTTSQITLGQLSATLIYVTQMIQAQSQLLELIPALASKSVSVNAFLDFMQKKPTITEAADAKEVDFAGADIVAKDISFSYISQLPVLESISLHIPGGRWTGIKAPSGYGKTTLLNLILRLYDVQGGSISIGGIDVRQIRSNCFRDQIAVVMQHQVFARDTLRRTIAYDKDDASLEQIRRAASFAGIDDFIMTLPEQYETQCGDAAARLSQGQRQRLMIARALLREPRILIMDEAFGSVDKETEDRIVADMRSHFPRMTVIVVSHHQSVLDKMDGVVDLTKESREREARFKGYFKVTYFDLGMHSGQEIDAVLNQIAEHPMVSDMDVYGIDANPVYHANALAKYRNDTRARFHFENFAVASGNGVAKLYICPDDRGSSIYADKWRVTDRYLEVPARRFADWLTMVPAKGPRDIWILKANIEGAEWDLINDLEKNSMIRHFDYYMGSTPGRFSDIEKVKSLVEQQAHKKCLEILDRHDIRVLRYCYAGKDAENVNLRFELSRKARQAEKMLNSQNVEVV